MHIHVHGQYVFKLVKDKVLYSIIQQSDELIKFISTGISNSETNICINPLQIGLKYMQKYKK